MSPEFQPYPDNPFVNVDEQRILYVVNKALEARKKREGIFKPELLPPEHPFVAKAKEYEGHRDQQDFALNAVFFITPVIYADDSFRQFHTMTKDTVFEDNVWLFLADHILRTDKDKFLEALQNYTAAGYNGLALPWWQVNARTLVNRYGGNIRNFFEEHHNDAEEILKFLTDKKFKKTDEGFRRFGNKIGTLFLQWVHQYNLAPLENMNKIGIPVDFQVTRLMVQTKGVVIIDGKPVNRTWVQEKALIPAFRKLLELHPEYNHHISETLWFIGNLCCNNYNHEECPLKEECTSLISRTPLDEDNLVDPTDIGRHQTKKGRSVQVHNLKQEAVGQTRLLDF